METAIGRPPWTKSGSNRGQAAAAGQIFRRTTFVDEHVGLAMGKGDATRTVEERHRQGVRGGPGADEEDRGLAFEQHADPVADRLVQVAGAVGRRIVGRLGCEGGRDLRVGAGPIVGGENHRGKVRLYVLSRRTILLSARLFKR
jgi:hypothetical protein